MSEEGVDFAHCCVVVPVIPVLLSITGSLSSDSSGNSSIRKQEITRDTIVAGMVNSVQDCCCGSGNRVLKKLVSETFSLKNFPFLKARDATSDIVLLSPAMCRGVKLDAFC